VITAETGIGTDAIQLTITNELTSSIASELFSLGSLERLAMFNNTLTGTIPSKIGTLSSLSYLNFENNLLMGTIPAQIGLLLALVELRLDSNDLTGSISSELGNCSRLQYLVLSANKLSNRMPSSLGALSSLYRLELGRNSLTGPLPESIANCGELTFLSLNENGMTSSIPSELSNLTNLLVLSVHGNKFTSTIPSQIGALTSLVDLFLYSNAFTGPISNAIVKLSSLESLHLNDNNFSGTIPSSIGALSLLKEANFAANLFRGAIPGTFAFLSNTTNLRLDGNTNLCRLDEESTKATSKCLQVQCPYPVCQCTGISCPSGATNSGSSRRNPASPFYPADDALCCTPSNSLLEKLVSDGHADCSVGRSCVAITGTPEKGTRALEVSYESYGLTGDIPSFLGEFTYLKILRLANNRLIGAIPGTLNRLRNATDVRLDNNLGLCVLDAESATVTQMCSQLCTYPKCGCVELYCANGATNIGSSTTLTAQYYPNSTVCCQSGKTLRERLVIDSHIDCSMSHPCKTTEGVRFKGSRAISLIYNKEELTRTIPQEIDWYVQIIRDLKSFE
jgi:Leucine-rich repeat (LRR) protein